MIIIRIFIHFYDHILEFNDHKTVFKQNVENIPLLTKYNIFKNCMNDDDELLWL